MTQFVSKRPSAETLAGMRHLEQASQLLMATSPALSAFLESQRITLASASSVSANRNEMLKVCGACSSALVPGWSCKTSRIPSRLNRDKKDVKKAIKKNKHGHLQSAEGQQIVIYECLRCHTKTKINITSQRPKAARRSKPEILALEESTAQTPAPFSKPAILAGLSDTHRELSAKENDRSDIGANAKKRARKTKHGGLQALLAKSKSESTSRPGFDLMDFMKSG